MALISIALITAALVIILSALNGLSGLVSDIYNAPEPDLCIRPKTGKYFIPDSRLIQRLSTHPQVISYSSILEDKALIQRDNEQLLVTVKGVDSHLNKVLRLSQHIVEGKKTWDSASVFIGNGIANSLQLNLNSEFNALRLISPKNQDAYSTEAGINELFLQPTAIFSLNDEFDFSHVFIPLSKARQLFEITGSITAVYVAVNETDRASLLQELNQFWGNTYEFTDRNKANEVLFKTLESEKLMTIIILGFILSIAVFNIIGAITMLIMEKKQDIKTLMALGMEFTRIQTIFMWEGLLITGIGSVLGLLTGILFCFLQQHFHWISFGNDAIISYYPVIVKWQDVLMLFTLVLALSALTGLYPIRFFTKKFKV